MMKSINLILVGWAIYFVIFHILFPSQSEPVKADKELTTANIIYHNDEVLYKKTYYPNGGLELEGPYLNELKSGIWKEYFYRHDKAGAPKLKALLSLKNGNYQGKSYQFNKMGQVILTAHFTNGNLDGVETYYDDNGLIKQVTHYKTGKKHGIETTYFDGTEQIKTKVQFEQGERNGEAFTYYKNGQLKQIETFKKDILQGLASYYREHGSLNKNVNYVDGDIQTERRFYQDASVECEQVNKTLTYCYAPSNEEGSALVVVKSRELITQVDSKIELLKYFNTDDQLIQTIENKSAPLINTSRVYGSDGELLSIHTAKLNEPYSTKDVFDSYGALLQKHSFLNLASYHDKAAYFSQNSLLYPVSFIKEQKHGEHLDYYPSGKIKARKRYLDDLLNGMTFIYHPDGALKNQQYFIEGKAVSWFENTLIGFLNRLPDTKR